MRRGNWAVTQGNCQPRDGAQQFKTCLQKMACSDGREEAVWEVAVQNDGGWKQQETAAQEMEGGGGGDQ